MVDYALRRRFRFITLHPEFASKQFQRWLGDAGVNGDLVKKIVTRMSALNEVIAADTKNLGSGYQIGHSYFCPTQNGGPPDDKWYRRVVETEIVPLLREYWFDDEPKVEEQRAALLA
jgi:5-methylcytosine-specific restriction protein B